MSTSEIVKKFSQRTDTIVKSREILSGIADNLTRPYLPKLINEANEMHDNHVKTALTFKTGLPQQVEVQTTIYNTQMYAKLRELAIFEKDFTTRLLPQLDQFEELLHQTRISMELLYQINNIQSMPEAKLSKLCLTDVAPRSAVMHRLSILTKAVDALMDIKAIVAEPVMTINDQGASLTNILELCSLDDSLKISDKVVNGEFNQYLDISSTRPVHRFLRADVAGYNNMACSDIFSILCKLTAQTSKVYKSWLVDRPRYAEGDPRMIQVIDSLSDVTYQNDQVDTHTAIMTRFNRVNTAMNLLIQVVYPSLATEMDAFCQICEELGAHKVLDNQAKFVEPEQKQYPLYQAAGEAYNYLAFLQRKQSHGFPQYVLPAFNYCRTEVKALADAINITSWTEFDFEQDIAPINIDQLTTYQLNWAELAKMAAAEINALLLNERPVNSWSSLELNNQLINTNEVKADALLDANNVTLMKDQRDILYPVRYQSDYRVNKARNAGVKASMLGYTDEAKQQALSAALESNKESLYNLAGALENFNTLINSFPSEFGKDDAVKFNYLYKSIASILQNVVFCKADLELVTNLKKR